MSREYVANVILGIRFTMGEGVVARRVVHSCDHEERISRRFCSECGAKVWQRTECDDEAEERLVSKIGAHLPSRYKLLRQDDSEGQPYFLGYGMTFGYSDLGSGFVPAADPEAVRFEIDHILKKVGLTEESLADVQFGLHTFISSY